jgi:HAD superfamily hydrolase (TIGR01509 family)
MRVAAVIFDMDGLMIDTEGPVQACCQEAAIGMGFDLDDEFYVAELVGRGWQDCDTALTRRFGPQFLLSDFKDRFQQLWAARLRAGRIDVKPGLPELISSLRAASIPIAIATSTYRDDARLSLQAAGIDGPFDAFVTGDEVTHGKPHPEIYLLAASRLRVDPQMCVALEDSSAGALAAACAGMRTLVIPDNGRALTPQAASAAFRILSSLHEARAMLNEWITDVSNVD